MPLVTSGAAEAAAGGPSSLADSPEPNSRIAEPPTVVRAPSGEVEATRADAPVGERPAPAAAAAAAAQSDGDEAEAEAAPTLRGLLPSPVGMHKALHLLLLARSDPESTFEPSDWLERALAESGERSPEMRDFLEQVVHDPRLGQVEKEPTCLRRAPEEGGDGHDEEDEEGCGCGIWGSLPLADVRNHALQRCAWRGGVHMERPECKSTMHPRCMLHGQFCSLACAQAADNEEVECEEAAAADKPTRKRSRHRSSGDGGGSNSRQRGGSDDSEPSDDALRRSYAALDLEPPGDDAEPVTAAALRAAHERVVRVAAPVEADGGAGGDEGEGEGGADDGGDGLRSSGRLRTGSAHAALEHLLRHHGHPIDSSSGPSPGAEQVAAARRAVRKAEQTLPMAQAQVDALVPIEEAARTAGTLGLEALAGQARAVLELAEHAAQQVEEALETAATQLLDVQHLIEQGVSASTAASQGDDARRIKADKGSVTASKTRCDELSRTVGRIVERVRRTFQRIEGQRQRGTTTEAEALRDALGAQQPAAHLTLTAESLLEAAGIAAARRPANHALSEALLESAQYNPMSAGDDAGADAAVAAAPAADAAAGGAAAAVSTAAWATHVRLQHPSMPLGRFLDDRCVALLRRADFPTAIVPYADALANERPVGASPGDLVKSATGYVEVHVGSLAAQQGEPTRKIYSKARLCIAALFDDERDGEEARAALAHLHEKPCTSKAKDWCKLCVVYTSIANRWEALADASRQPWHRGVDLFSHKSARPAVLVCNTTGSAAMQAGAALPDAPARLLADRLSRVAHHACTAGCMREKLVQLRARGFVECPSCARSLGEPDGSGSLVEMVDACEPAARKRGHTIDFGANGTARSRAAGH